MRDNPKPFEIYRHFKGKTYQIICLCKDSETGEQKVVYQALYEPYEIYVRSLEMFLSPVDAEKYPNATQKERFKKVTPNVVPAVTVEEKKEELNINREEEKPAAYKVDEGLMNFLKARTNAEKLDVLVSMKDRLDEKICKSMAVSLDLTLAEGSVMDQYEQIKTCLFLKERYEQVRRG